MLPASSETQSQLKNFLLGLIDVDSLSIGKREEPMLSQCVKVNGRYRITHDGMEKSLSEWAEYLGINRHTLYSRIRRGWSVEDALYRPIHRHQKDVKSLTKIFFEALGGLTTAA